MGTPSPRRVYFVDVLRILASLQMINGHTLDALLLPAWESGPTFSRYVWFRGLVSVAFLLVAGMAYNLATLQRFEAHKASPDGARKRFRRGLDLILIGYALRIPWAVVYGGPEGAIESAWYRFLGCGVLQCIGVTLLMLESLTWVSRRPQQVVTASAGLAAAMVVLAPFADGLVPSGVLRGVVNYVSHQGGSPFPVLPWGAFMLIGVVLGAVVLPKGAATPLWQRLLRIGAVFAVSYATFQWLKGVDFPGVTEITTYSSKPVAIFDRLSGIMVLVGGLAVLCHPIRRLPAVLAIVSGETLAVYVIHLVLLFHPPFYLAGRIGRSSLELGPALAASMFMILTTTGLTLLWHEQKRRRWLRRLRDQLVAWAFGRSERGVRAGE